MPPLFELSGHRGARGLRPENTLPSFEAALDAGVRSIETDVHLTRDGVPVLIHDARVTPHHFRPAQGAQVPHPTTLPPVAGLTLRQLQDYRADRNPDPRRFPDQEPVITPLASLFAESSGSEPYAVPTLGQFLAFVEAYVGEPGRTSGKSDQERARAGQVILDLELKRVPFRPERIGDTFDARQGGLLERQVLQVVESARLAGRTRVRSFDHQVLVAVHGVEPGVQTAILVARTAPFAPAEMVRAAGAGVYCPDFEFLDERQVKQIHAAGYAVIPWTVNDPEDWNRLLDWGVDGITTDFPDRLAALLLKRGIAF